MKSVDESSAESTDESRHLEGEGAQAEQAPAASQDQVLGERSVSSVNRASSLQARLTNFLAVSLMASLAVGLLVWYYREAYVRHVQAPRAHASAALRVADAPLPALGPIDPPATASPATPSAVSAPESAGGPTALALVRVLGPAPPVPTMTDFSVVPVTRSQARTQRTGATGHSDALARELGGPAFAGAPEGASDAEPAVPPASADPQEAALSYESGRASAGTGSAGPLATLLTPSVTAPVRASVLPTQELLLPKGAFIDCTLETAIDSSLPGLTTCITAADTFSADGRVVLLERGTKLVGETRGTVQQGASRVFVLWTEARTPTGVVVPLDSPGTDELGRSGLPGAVNRHFFERFGAALLISVLDGAVQAEIASQSRGGAVIYSPTGSEDVMTEALRGTVNIPPTVVKRNGDRIEVLVARDIDFRSVYELRPASR